MSLRPPLPTKYWFLAVPGSTLQYLTVLAVPDIIWLVPGSTWQHLSSTWQEATSDHHPQQQSGPPVRIIRIIFCHNLDFQVSPNLWRSVKLCKVSQSIQTSITEYSNPSIQPLALRHIAKLCEVFPSPASPLRPLHYTCQWMGLDQTNKQANNKTHKQTPTN